MQRDFKYKIIVNYCIIFYLLMAYKWTNGMFLYQLHPFFLVNRPDIFTWIFLETGLPHWLLNNPVGCVGMDTVFYILPLVYLLVYEWKPGISRYVALLMLLVNWAYVQCYTLVPSNSIEGHTAWLLFPIAFFASDQKTFQLLFGGLRYFFLYFLVSAGIWKFVQGGIFDLSQMSGVLLYQHKELLTNSPGYWQSRMILFFILHRKLSYLLYLSATLLELSFLAGFFTRRFDRILLAAFLLFLVADYIVMRIPYFEMLPFVLTLIYVGDQNAEVSPARDKL